MGGGLLCHELDRDWNTAEDSQQWRKMRIVGLDLGGDVAQ